MKTFKDYEQQADKILATGTFSKGADIKKIKGQLIIKLIGTDRHMYNWAYEKSLRDKCWLKYLR